MEKNKSVVIYGAGFRGGRNFLALAEENVHDQVVDYLEKRGIEIYTCFEEFFQGLNDAKIETRCCGKKASFQIVPKLLERKDGLIAYSFGIGFDFSFERELAEKLKLNTSRRN